MSNLKLLSEAKIWTHNEKVFLTDPPGVVRSDAVFPLCAENRYFADHLGDVHNGRVLDLCTGCGILSIVAAEKARQVVAVDISPRAIEFAKVNAALNGVMEKIDFRVGNLFEPVKGEVFDLIIVNPPFEPIPSGFRYYTHSDGGANGMTIVQKICENVNEYLSPQGVFQMIGYFPYNSSILKDHLESLFQSVTINTVTTIPKRDFKKYLLRQLSLLNPQQQMPEVNNIDLTCMLITAKRSFSNRRQKDLRNKRRSQAKATL